LFHPRVLIVAPIALFIALPSPALIFAPPYPQIIDPPPALVVAPPRVTPFLKKYNKHVKICI